MSPLRSLTLWRTEDMSRHRYSLERLLSLYLRAADLKNKTQNGEIRSSTAGTQTRTVCTCDFLLGRFSKGHIKKDVLHLHPLRNKIFNLVLTELYVDDLVLL